MRASWWLVLCSLIAPTATSLKLRLEASAQAASPNPSSPDKVHVAYTFDRYVFNETLRSMLSLSYHSSAPRLVIHMLVPSSDVEGAERVRSCFTQQLESHAAHLRGGKPEVQITTLRDHAPIHLEYNFSAYMARSSQTVQARLFMQEYLPEVNRVLYLDSDTLVTGDVAQLFAKPMSNLVAAGLGGRTLAQWTATCPNAAKYIVNTSKLVFNSGVMMMDLARWRQENISASMTKLDHMLNCSSDDQLLLNAQFQSHQYGFDQLGREWNRFVLARDMSQDFPDNILHFIREEKPWKGEHNHEFLLRFRDSWMPGGHIAAADSGSCVAFPL